MRDAPRYEVGKASGGKWAVYLRLDERTSIDQRTRFATKRAATSICSLLNRELAEINANRKDSE